MSSTNWNANLPPHIYQQLMHGNWSPSPIQTSPILPDDAEQEDCHEIGMEIEKYMEREYPKFEPEIIYTSDKEYYLPALKVLLHDGKRYFSPSYREQWVDGELRAHCQEKSGVSWHTDWTPRKHEEVPDEECDCGIYGSVNLEEINHYLYSEYEPITKFDVSPLLTMDFNNPNQLETYTYPSIQKKEVVHLYPTLCIIEPMPDAKVILCRKGWKASHAFISEIVRETISVENASQLLSIAWKRNIDLRETL